ncbi:MAG: hypothetical protein F4X22_02840 [Gemmatimonadales bacterium]|nr:hypothetical protein [Candidatus Palauibacter denitrificans]
MLRGASIALLAVVLSACMESVPTAPVSYAESPRVGDSGLALQTTWTFNPQDNTSEKERRRRNVQITASGDKKYRIRISGQLRDGTTHTKAKSLPKGSSEGNSIFISLRLRPQLLGSDRLDERGFVSVERVSRQLGSTTP